MKHVIIIFDSGYEHDIDVEVGAGSDEYWTAITESKNPYDASDEPVAFQIQEERVELDDDGDWLIDLDQYIDESCA